MIESPFLLVVLGMATVAVLARLMRSPRREDEYEQRTKELTAKLDAATREVDAHIAAYRARKGGRRG